MSTTTTDSHLFVEEVVTALTGAVDAGANVETAVKSQMRHAAEEFDQRTAEAFARALLDHLCQDPSDLRRLEALIIMGLAHPSILEKHRISLATEGERLILLLERAGQTARARCLKDMLAQHLPPPERIVSHETAPGDRPLKTAECIELYLQRADDACARGRTAEAIKWLEEVVALDRNRRDVARMIRDLRLHDTDRREKNARHGKLAFCFLLVAAAIVGTAFRERRIAAAFQDIRSAKSGDLASLRARATAIDALISEEHIWLGAFQAWTERDRLEREIDELAHQETATVEKAVLEVEKSTDMAELARLRGMQFAKEGKFEAALVDLKRALELGPANWEHKKRIQADVAAIEAWRSKSK